MQQLQPGTLLQGGKYRIERVLGQGGFGNTYEAYNTEFEETVAIKEFFMKGVTERNETTCAVSVSNAENVQQFEEQREKFKKEARRLRKLKNEHIVKVHDLFEENGTAYYVMDYIDGESLKERLDRTNQPLTENEIEKILPQILDALNEVHSHKMWHLDLKPANIMVDKLGVVKLIDFGASKQFNTHKGGATTSTAVSYTNGYAPREQMEQNYEKFGPWTDFYALGATLYNLLTNKRPPLPSDIDDDETEDKHKILPFPDDVRAETKSLVLWMLNTNRQQRPQSVDAIMNRYYKEDNENKNATHPISTEPQISTQEVAASNEEETIVVNKETESRQGEKMEQEKVPISSNAEHSDSNVSDDDAIWKGIMFLFIGAIVFLLCIFYSNSGAGFFKKDSEQLYVDSMPSDTTADEYFNGSGPIVVEYQPEYPGGTDALMTFLSDNIKYPKEAQEQGIEGRVLVTFIVERDGSINSVLVEQSVNELLDKEAVRVVKLMPKWIPGKHHGEPVRVRYTLPINFKLK